MKLKFVVFDSFLLEVDEDLRIEEYKEILKKVFTFKKGDTVVRFNFKIEEGYSWGDLMNK